MNELMKIGEFANLINTTTKTLRHYEDIGLFTPVYRDPITGYRYYHTHQLKDIYTIISLKKAGISIKKIEKNYNKDKLKDLLLEASHRLEDEIEELIKLKISVDRKINTLDRVDDYKENIKIEFKFLEKRDYLIHRFSPINSVDGEDIYRRSLEFEKIIAANKLPFLFKGSLLSLEALKQDEFLLEALIYEVKDTSKVNTKNIYTSSKGKYLCIGYRGDPKIKNKSIMGIINSYMKDNSIEPCDEVIGFSHTGAHTNSYLKDYWSEIQIKVL